MKNCIKNKEELNNKLNRLLGTLATVRTVDSPSLGAHWVDYPIEYISKYRNNLFNDKLHCALCQGSGAVFDGFAETIEDAMGCPKCFGYGFETSEIKEPLVLLKELAKSKSSSSVENCVDEILTILPL